jgi:hypothetical protein
VTPPDSVFSVAQKVVQTERRAVDTLINGLSMILRTLVVGQRCCRNSCVICASPDKRPCPDSRARRQFL